MSLEHLLLVVPLPERSHNRDIYIRSPDFEETRLTHAELLVRPPIDEFLNLVDPPNLIMYRSLTRAELRRLPGTLEGSCKATWKREVNPPWRKAGPPNHHDDKVDLDQ